MLVFTDKTRPQRSLTQACRVKECWKEDFPLNSEKKVEGSGASLLQVQAEGAGPVQSLEDTAERDLINENPKGECQEASSAWWCQAIAIR